MLSITHRKPQEWGEQPCVSCSQDQAAHIALRRQGVCANFTVQASTPTTLRRDSRSPTQIGLFESRAERHRS
jgi:hypothetical protein